MPKKRHDIFPMTCDIDLIASEHVETVVLLSKLSDAKHQGVNENRPQ